MLMAYEDIHWSDPTTRELLDLLIDRAPSLRVLAILGERGRLALNGENIDAGIVDDRAAERRKSRLIVWNHRARIQRITGGQTRVQERADRGKRFGRKLSELDAQKISFAMARITWATSCSNATPA